MLAAGECEFRHRFWVIGAIFGLAFFCYNFDHQNAADAITNWLARAAARTPTSNDYRLTLGAGALFTATAALLRTWATSYLKSEVMIAARVQTAHLVADGPYRHVRNPLYLGNILLAVGFGVMASRAGFVVMVLGMVVFCYRLILREEAGIAAQQGESYRAYCAAVPRLWPALHPKVPSAGGSPNWRDGLLGEAFFWVLAAAEVAFAITLNNVVFFAMLGASFVFYAICVAVITRRQKRAADAAVESSNRQRE
jgi:protein-S-isoprenylcysteine O-methyltransferase Ste14